MKTTDRYDTIGKNGSMNRPLLNRILIHPFFRGMNRKHVEILSSSASEETFKPGQILFKQGEPASRFYLIEAGEIALEAHQPADGTVLIQKLSAGDVLGWSWLFPPFTWHFQARALSPTKAIVLSGAHMLTAAEEDNEFGYELMKRVSQLTVQRLQQTRNQLLADNIESALKG